jgi:hypothetical protein
MSYGYRYSGYLQVFDIFLAILRARERQRYGNELLAGEWDGAKQNSGFMVANALENWTAMDWLANRYFNWRAYGGKRDVHDRITAYIRNDLGRKTLVARKSLE